MKNLNYLLVLLSLSLITSGCIEDESEIARQRIRFERELEDLAQKNAKLEQQQKLEFMNSMPHRISSLARVAKTPEEFIELQEYIEKSTVKELGEINVDGANVYHLILQNENIAQYNKQSQLEQIALVVEKGFKEFYQADKDGVTPMGLMLRDENQPLFTGEISDEVAQILKENVLIGVPVMGANSITSLYLSGGYDLEPQTKEMVESKLTNNYPEYIKGVVLSDSFQPSDEVVSEIDLDTPENAKLVSSLAVKDNEISKKILETCSDVCLSNLDDREANAKTILEAIKNDNQTLIRFFLIENQIKIKLSEVIKPLIDYMLDEAEGTTLPNMKSSLLDDYLDKRDMIDELRLVEVANDYIEKRELVKASYLEKVFRARELDSALEKLEDFENVLEAE